MQADPDIEATLELLIAARQGRTTLGSLPDELKPADTQTGYVLQDALTTALGETPVGWKVACTNSAAQELMQTHEPFAGPLFESMLHDSPAELSSGQFNMRMVEGEFAFRLGTDLPARAEPYTRTDVEAAIASVHPAIEIADSRFADWLAVGLPSLIADGAVAGAFVYGAGRSDWRELDLINVVGKTEPVPVYELLAESGGLDGTKARVIALYEQALAKYRRRNFGEAEKLFGEALSLDGDDGPARTMAARCRLFLAYPPPDGWNGSFEMTEK